MEFDDGNNEMEVIELRSWLGQTISEVLPNSDVAWWSWDLDLRSFIKMYN